MKMAKGKSLVCMDKNAPDLTGFLLTELVLMTKMAKK